MTNWSNPTTREKDGRIAGTGRKSIELTLKKVSRYLIYLCRTTGRWLFIRSSKIRFRNTRVGFFR